MIKLTNKAETENSWGDLRKMWADADKKAKDWREAGEYADPMTPNA